ncbi:MULTISPECIES: DNA translocase FtsK [Rahnella]|uniref:FtsK gamma domain-containing protein n=1 Tax=Rahnella laticis TaxID=2787622 RepID=A0ABS0DZ28_9GAMM|nr:MULTISPECIES: DNA translocase FtsK [Rahnella]MBF7978072.1 hypothetical protein [Rahnella laticis]MBF7998211.1 hypothetical protein [Rahnella sp. LAC-M12]
MKTICDQDEYCTCPACRDELYPQAESRVIESGNPNISFLEREFKIGYGRAARLIKSMEEEGIVSPHDFKGVRKVLVKEQPHE